MALPIRTFFALYKEANKLQAKEYRENLRINLTPKMEFKYFEQMDAMYCRIIDPKPIEMRLPPKPVSTRGMDLASIETKNRIIQFFSGRRRGF